MNLIDLFTLLPSTKRTHKNYSKEIYNVFTSDRHDGAQLDPSKLMNINIYEAKLVEQLIEKLDERYKGMSDAYRYFDQYSRGKVTFSEFQLILQNIGMVLSYQDLSTLFKFFDSDNKSYFTYPDFCKITTYKNQELELKSPFQKKNFNNSSYPNRKDL